MTSLSFERLEACGFCYSLMPVAKHYYAHDPAAAKAFYQRHTIFYNTEPQVGQLINGIVVSLEEGKALGGQVPDDLPIAVKTALMGPLAGIGDTLIQGVVVPTLLSIAMGLAAGGSIAGPVFYILAWLAFGIALTYVCFMGGYRLGEGAMSLVMGPIAVRITSALNVLGIMVVGALAASNVILTTTLQVASADGTVPLQTVIDGAFPQLLPLIAVLLTWHLIAHKHFSATKTIIVLCAVAIIGCIIGVL